MIISSHIIHFNRISFWKSVSEESPHAFRRVSIIPRNIRHCRLGSLDVGAVCASVVVAHHAACVVLVDLRAIAASAADVQVGCPAADQGRRVDDLFRGGGEILDWRWFDAIVAGREHGLRRGPVRGYSVNVCCLHSERCEGAAAFSCAAVLAIEAGWVVVDEHRTKSALAADPVSSVGHNVVQDKY